METHQVVLMPGDGIVVLEASGEILPAQTVESIGRYQVALKGPYTTPIREEFLRRSIYSCGKN